MPEFYFLEYADFSRYCVELALMIKQGAAGEKIDYLVSIQRGGAMMSKVISDVLQVPIATIVVSSYQDLQQAKQAFISQEISVEVTGKNVIVLDEICDTGETLHLVSRYLESRQPNSVKTAVIYQKTHAKFKPDYWAAETDKWVVFPGEVFETARVLNTMTNLPEQVKTEFSAYISRQGIDPQTHQTVLQPALGH